MTTILAVPEEILEIIFGFLCPYQDYLNSRLVCSQWKRIMSGLVLKKRQEFLESVKNGSVLWKLAAKSSGVPAITERHSHSACYLDGCMYVFGGCTAKNTTFNDLWRYNLSTKTWTRPLANGTYPTPKAFASMVVWREKLVLYGGWSQPTPFPLHQAAQFFDQLHVFDPSCNHWTQITTEFSPPGVAGHSACVLNNHMIVYGGSQQHGKSTDSMWSLDLMNMRWTLCSCVDDRKPAPRYGAAMSKIDNNQAVLLGGLGGPNMKFSDCWLLHFVSPTDCEWTEIDVLNRDLAPTPLWCHPACKVGDCFVVLSKTNSLVPPDVLQRLSSYRHVDDKSRSASSYSSSSSDDEELRSGSSSQSGHFRNQSQRRQKRLAMLQKYEQRFKSEQQKKVATSADLLKNPMFVHVLDLDTLKQGFVSWRTPNLHLAEGCAPEDTYFYTAVEGRGEIIVFGGIYPDNGNNMQRDNSASTSVLSNEVHILLPLSAKKVV